MQLQTISNSIAHDNLGTISAIIVEFDGPGVGHAYFSKKSNRIVHDKYNKHHFSYNHKKYGPGVGHANTYKRFSGSIVHDNASTVSAAMTNLYGPGARVAHTSQTISNSIVHNNLSTTAL